GGTFAYTIEMATQFIPAADQVPTIVQNQLTAAKILLSRKNSKTLTGHITDAVTGQPLAAKVWIVGLDDHITPRAHYYSSEDFGSYWRFLSEGTHMVKYLLPGYQTQTHTVSISTNSATVLNIQMVPSIPVLQSFHVWDYQSNPLADVQITFPDLDLEPLYTDAMGMAFTPNFYPGEYRVQLSKPGYETISMLRSFVGGNAIFRLSDNALFSDDFESGTGNWSLNSTWGLSQNDPISGQYCLTDSPAGNYGGNLNSSAILNIPLNLSTGANFNLQFWAKHSIANDGDHAILAYRADGTAYYTLHVFSGTQPWTHYSFDFNGLSGNNVNIAFRMVTTSSGTADGIYIDDLKFYGSTTPTDTEAGVTSATAVKLRSYPNPFGQDTVIRLEGLTKASQQPDLAIFNLRGQRVRMYPGATLQDSTITWDGRDEQGLPVANGVYFIRAFQGAKALATHKVLKLKR
ncbi:MAG TPA: FlgD immunoglobulin-like domain containing protein, partial [Candidatus Cloacimonadota bacterium]|nr:FlgD immunoglobulin-like domain containing protein [Candidatus Cloacimonadota bacterium]